VLLDSNRKKTRFLTHVVLTLGIKNVKIVSERVEKFSFACGFDTILSRATMSLKELVSKTKHLYASAGQLLAMKGKYPQDELDEITGVTEVHCLSDNPKRHVVQIKF
jgi:16S rRNA (guanine527-N7)-methyltransferase